jgi:RNA polymerase sigma-70 factor (ECF subfamily)
MSLDCAQAIEEAPGSFTMPSKERHSDLTTQHPDALMRILYESHAAALRRYARRLTGDGARAEDVAQETLVRAWRHPEVMRGERPVRGWLFTVARNLVIDEHKTARFRNEVCSTYEAGVPDRPGPDEMNAALDRLLIREALAQLSDQHRAVIRRSYYLGWTTAQIAADLQIAEGTVKSRSHNATRALRSALQKMGVTR